MLEVDWESIFAQAPSVMGLPELKLRGGRWNGPYYLTGAECQRQDKMVVMRGKRGDGMITVSEQGGETVTILDWLITYAHMDAKTAYRHIKQLATREYVPVEAYKGESKVISLEDFRNAGGGRKKWNNPLYRYLVGCFGKEKVDRAFWLYNVTDGLVERKKRVMGTRFWYVNRTGEILFDKTMFYKPDGHRDKEINPMRQYKVRKGYDKVCFFGEHLLKKGRPVMVVESEKSAIICSLAFPDYQWVACGGLKCLKRLGNLEGFNVWLVPDVDGAKEWSQYGKVWPWWEKCGRHVKEKSDLADMVMLKYGNQAKEK